MICDFSIDSISYSINVEGDFSYGKDEVLFHNHSTILNNCSWKNEGFVSLPVFNTLSFSELCESIYAIVLKIFDSMGIAYPSSFSLENYHEYVTDEQHQEVINKTRFLTLSDFNLDFDSILKLFSEEIGIPLSFKNPLLEKEIIILRINRPLSLDINPFHRDGYLDIWADVLNVWIPIIGCTPNSSLPVIPKSHFWNEKDVLRTQAKGASINGLHYHVPAIISYKDGLHACRPNPIQGKNALVFTPFLVHGSALNNQENCTRFSLELRLNKV